jgi:hypothetical protein
MASLDHTTSASPASSSHDGDAMLDRKLSPSPKGGAKRSRDYNMEAKRVYNRESAARARKKVKEQTAELYRRIADASDKHTLLQEQHEKLVALTSSLAQENQMLRNMIMEQNTSSTSTGTNSNPNTNTNSSSCPNTFAAAGEWGEATAATQAILAEVGATSAPSGMIGSPGNSHTNSQFSSLVGSPLALSQSMAQQHSQGSSNIQRVDDPFQRYMQQQRQENALIYPWMFNDAQALTLSDSKTDEQ